MTGGLLVAGTTSDAGKSLLTAGICRWLHRRGVRVAPFKAQNMSNNSYVTLDGGEIGRAQALQAAACGLEPSVRFNPVLLKPGSDRQSQVVVLGRAVGTVSALSYRERKTALLEVVLDTLAGLRADHDVVICEGAGSPAEINLRATDIANLGLARAAGLGVVVVGDIDRGGVFASMYGTLALLSPADQALVAGFVVNKFRGDPSLLAPGLDMLTRLTGRPVLGTVPYVDDLWLDAEDSLSYGADGVVGRPGAPHGTEWLRVAVPRLPRMSNVTDVEALAAEPGVRVRLVTGPSGVADADLVVLPGSKSTVDDLRWLRDTGLADAVQAHAAAGRPVLGVCGGYQMLGERIVDEVESGAGVVAGLGLLPVTVTFEPEKTLGRPTGRAAGGQPVAGYEIHHGVAAVRGGEPLFRAGEAEEGCRVGAVWGTHWHGAFESDEFRRVFLAEVAHAAGRTGFAAAPDTSVAALRERTLDLLGDLVEEHLDTGALLRLIETGPPTGLPFVPPGAPEPPAGTSPADTGRPPVALTGLPKPPPR
jgi:adenosylcobyric acid synthase